MTHSATPLRIRSKGAIAIAADPHTDELISMAEVADRLGISLRTVRRWIADGYLPARRFGPKLLRIRASDLDALGTEVVTPGKWR